MKHQLAGKNFLKNLQDLADRKQAALKNMANLETNLKEIYSDPNIDDSPTTPPLVVSDVHSILESFKIVCKLNQQNCDMLTMRKISNFNDNNNNAYIYYKAH